MAVHKCDKEKEITEIHKILIENDTILKRLDKTLTGNGQPGLIQKVNKFEGAFNTLKYIIGPGLLLTLVIAIIK